MSDWDDHRLILALHRHGTLRAAGDALGVTHTTIARRLAAIQKADASPIFMRLGRRYQATDYGLERVGIAERIEKLDYEAFRLKTGSVKDFSGRLILSIPQAVYQYLLMDEIAEFSETYPDVELHVVGSDYIADLDMSEADVVIRGHASPPDHLVGRRICTVGLSFYAHKDYLAKTPPEARGWIAPSPKPGQSYIWPDWISETPCPDYPVKFVISDIPSRFLALTKGQGLSRAACFMADNHPDLVRLEGASVIPLYGLWVLTHPDLKDSPKISALVKTLSRALTEKKHLITG